MAGKEYLTSIKLSDIFPSFGKLISVKSTDQLSTVTKLLITNNLYALPVLENDKCIGLIDLNDLLGALCQTVGEVTQENGREKFALAESDGVRFNHLFAKDYINFSQRNPYTPISHNATLKEAVEALLSGTGRLPIISEEGNLLGIISPSTIVAYLSHHVTDPFLHQVLSVKVSTFPQKPVLSVDRNTPVIIAIQLLNSNRANSLAILDNSHLQSTFTLKDLKYINEPRKFTKLFQEIGDYITEIRRSSPKSIFPAIHCYTTSTLESVLLRLTATRIHRMFIVEPNNNQIPIGVVSLRDVLDTIYNRP